MFHVGDKVVYPMHGAGVIEALETREVLGQITEYYVMRLMSGDMKVMIPKSNVEDVGLRQVIGQDDVEKVYAILRGERTVMPHNWNRRYRANMEKMKTGDIFSVAEVVRNLGLRDREKGLSTGERRMLETARQILISELSMAESRTEQEVATTVEGLFEGK